MQFRHRFRAHSTAAAFMAAVLFPALVAGEGEVRVSAGEVRVSGETPARIAGMDPAGLARVDSAIYRAIRAGATPGASLVVGRGGEIVRLRGYGRIDWEKGSAHVTDSTLYDLASLTKVVGTTTAVMLLVQDGRLNLESPVGRYLSDWPLYGPKAVITVRDLLMHTSGLPAGADLWGMRGDRADKLRRLQHIQLVAAPGTRTIYSDVGMILLGDVVESITHQRLDNFLEQRAFRPLEMADTRFNPLVPLMALLPTGFNNMGQLPATILPVRLDAAAPLGFYNPAMNGSFFRIALGSDGAVALNRIAPTEIDTEVRRTHLHGEVHDLNAAALDGVAGHAGLFSSARDLAHFGQMMLDEARGERGDVLHTALVREFTERDGEATRALGWEFPSGRSSAGKFFSAESFGHTGFTGTSIWIDPEHDVFVVLLTNRVDPTSKNQKHLALRRAVHDAVQLAVMDQTIAMRDGAK